MPDDYADEKNERDERHDQRSPEIGRLRPHRVPAHLTTGGVSKEWYGGGDGSVHSSVSAPSHGLCGAFAPPLTHLITTHRTIPGLKPKPNPPIDASMLKSAKCSAESGRGG